MLTRHKEESKTKAEQIDLWRTFNVGRLRAVELGLDDGFQGFARLRTLDPKQYRISKKALDTLIWSAQGIVYKQAEYHSGYGISLPDLLQIGVSGAVYAAWKYNPDKAVTAGRSIAKFTSYAFFWIRAKIATAIAKDRLIYVPYGQKDSKYLYGYVSLDVLSEGVTDSEASVDSTSLIDTLLMSLDNDDEIACICSYFGIDGSIRAYAKQHNITTLAAKTKALDIVDRLKATFNI